MKRRTSLALTSGAALLALTVAGCSSDGGEETTSPAGTTSEAPQPVTLTLATFNTPGYTDSETAAEGDFQYDLIQEYMDANPHVTIIYDRKAESGDARENFFTKLGPGGLADVEMIEVDWMPEVMQYSDLLAEVDSSLGSRWLDWKTADATDPDGRLIGYGTDIGPQAVCYRASLFEAAGFPSDPAGVADLLEGDWDHFVSVGEDYYAATGKAFVDSAAGMWQGAINQTNPSYEDEATGEIIAVDNTGVKAAYDMVTRASEANVTSRLGQWSPEWFAGMSDGAYATMLCPPWMLGVISGTAADTTDWNVADVYPNGGGNWGGSWLVVPANGDNVAEAQKLADWLTAPEQQAKAFANAGTYPSQVAAFDFPEVSGAVNAFFNDAPIGEIFASRGAAVLPSPFKGQYYFQVNDAINNALTRVETRQQGPDAAWNQAVTDIEAIG